MTALLASVAGLAGLIWWSTSRLLSTLRDVRQDAARQRTLDLLRLLAPGIVAAGDDPRALLAWQPVARTARRMFPQEFTGLDEAWGTTFPFSADEIRAAHDRWTAAWLAWESAHDAEYKQRAAHVEEALGEQAGTPGGRARIEAVAREKLERYQRRYEDYARISKALRALADRP